MSEGRLRKSLQPCPLATVLALCAALLCGPGCGEPGPPALRLVAASSLGELATRLAEGFEARTGRAVTVRLGASSTLSRQLLQGAPGDVFLSADRSWVAPLEPIERRDWLGNRLVWVVPADGADVAPGEASSLALGGEGVPVGRYAEEALAARGLPLPERIVRGSHARATLAIVSSGAVDAGVVYATDAVLDPGVRVVESLPASAEHPLRYEAALLRPQGRPLYEMLHAPWLLAAAAELGFVVLP